MKIRKTIALTASLILFFQGCVNIVVIAQEPTSKAQFLSVLPGMSGKFKISLSGCDVGQAPSNLPNVDIDFEVSDGNPYVIIPAYSLDLGLLTYDAELNMFTVEKRVGYLKLDGSNYQIKWFMVFANGEIKFLLYHYTVDQSAHIISTQELICKYTGKRVSRKPIVKKEADPDGNAIEQKVNFKEQINASKVIEKNNEWQTINSDLNYTLNAVCFIPTSEGCKTGYAVGGNKESKICKIFKTTDGGLKWSVKTDNQDLLHSICFIPSMEDSKIGFAVGANGLIFKTIDGGDTWIKLSGVTSANLFSVTCFKNKEQNSTVFAQGSTFENHHLKFKLLKSMNGGMNWSELQLPVSDYIRGMNFCDENHGYIIGSVFSKELDILYETKDGGNSWSSTATFSKIDLKKVFFTDEKTGYLLCASPDGKKGFIMKTEDSGKNWTKQKFTFDGPSDLYFLKGGDGKEIGYVCCIKGEIFSTMDGGVNWKKEKSGTKERLNGIFSIKNSNGMKTFVVGESGTILVKRVASDE